MACVAESRHAVIGIGNDAAPGGKHAHLDALGVGLGTEPGLDLAFRVGMQFQFDTGGLCRALPGVIVGRGADSAEAEYDVGARQRAGQHLRDDVRFVGQVHAPRQPEAASLQQFDNLGKVLVLALSRQDFISNDECSEHVAALA